MNDIGEINNLYADIQERKIKASKAKAKQSFLKAKKRRK